MLHSTCIFAVVLSFLVSLFSLKVCPMLFVKEKIKRIKESELKVFYLQGVDKVSPEEVGACDFTSRRVKISGVSSAFYLFVISAVNVLI